MKKTLLNICLVISTLLAVSRAAGAGLINGGFETPAVAVAQLYSVAPAGFGWTVASGNIEIIASTYWQPSSGSQSIDMNGSTTGSIYQDFTFSSAGTWAVQFDLSANPDAIARGDGNGSGLKSVRVDFGTPGLMSTLGTYSLDAAPRTVGDMMWVTITTPQVVVSDSVVYRLQFTSLNAGNGASVLDNVQIAVPEPSAVTLLCVGLMGCLFLHRRKACKSNHSN